jgi:hypothetical protein
MLHASPTPLGCCVFCLAGITQTLTAIDNSTYGPTGLPVIGTVITIAEQGSMIARDGGAAGVG